MQNVYVFCQDYGEHLFHLFLDCDFVATSWQEVDISVGVVNHESFIFLVGFVVC